MRVIDEQLMRPLQVDPRQHRHGPSEKEKKEE
jgi:hypothetical protein